MGFVNDYEIKLTQAIADQRQDPVLVIVRRKPFLIAVNGIARQFVVQNRLGNVPRRTATGIGDGPSLPSRYSSLMAE